MGKFSHIIFASDIDGTFTGYNCPTSKANYEMIEYFKKNGGHFTFSSGRNAKDCAVVVKNIKDVANCPLILCNGSHLYDIWNDKHINPYYMNAEKVKELLFNITKKYPQVGLRSSNESGFLLFDDDKEAKDQLINNGLIQFASFVKKEDFKGEGLYKTVITYPDVDLLAEIREYIKKEYGEYFNVTQSWKYITEIQAKNVHKGTQIRYLKEELKKTYPNAMVCAIGDFDNDLEMLEAADVSFCPENAVDLIKSTATHTVCHCNDGAVAAAIELIEKKYL